MDAADTITIQANGLTFHALTWGQGPLVLLLHGFPDSAHTWQHVGPALAAQGRRVVAPFLRAYPPTDPAPDGRYDAEVLGRDVLALIEALGEARAVVVGHDWGALSTYAAASLDPSRIERMVAVAIPHPNTIAVTPQAAWQARHFLGLRLPGAAARFVKDGQGVRTLFERWSPAHSWTDAELADARQTLSDPERVHDVLGYYRALTPIPPAFLRTTIAVPTLLIAGRTDGALPPDGAAASQKAHTGPWGLRMLDGGHFCHVEDPAAFLDAVAPFVLSGVLPD